MKLDLDELARKARAATQEGPSDAESIANAEHIAANSPPVTLALIARIRELERILGETLADVGPSFADDPLYGRIEDALEKGALLP